MVMSYLIIKMLRDIKKYWMQFVSVFFMALISIMIFSGMAAVWNGSDITAENYSKATNLADVWIYTKGFNENIRDDIKNMRDIKNLERPCRGDCECPRRASRAVLHLHETPLPEQGRRPLRRRSREVPARTAR